MIDLNYSRNLAVRRRAGCFHNLFLLTVLIAGFGLMLAGPVTAQTFTTLHSFTISKGFGGSGGLILSSNTLYGTTASRWGSNTVFKLNDDGTGFTTLYSFTALPPWPDWTNSDGAFPQARLTLSGNTLYGTCLVAGSGGGGTVFKVNTDGTGFTLLHHFTADPELDSPFTNSDGAGPNGLILSGNTLYGTAGGGGSSGNGTVFKVNTDGTDFTNLHSFTAPDYNNGGTNSDGANLEGGLILSGNILYGTAAAGGSSGWGTVFKVNTDGTGFTTLHSFSAGSPSLYTNSDGAGPNGLILSGNTLYGTAQYGGSAGNGGSSGLGTVFAVKTDGTAFTTLHSFSAFASYTNSNGLVTNSDGIFPQAGLILSGNTLYGTAGGGGSSGNGTVFAVNTDGTGFSVLHSFTAISSYPSYTNSDGAYPSGGLFLSGSILYGTAVNGGSSGWGTVFSISFRPKLTTIPSAGHLILTWPTNYAGFDYSGYTLQSATNLVLPVWSMNLTSTVVVNGQKTVTNLISGTQQFFRLSQ